MTWTCSVTLLLCRIKLICVAHALILRPRNTFGETSASDQPPDQPSIHPAHPSTNRPPIVTLGPSDSSSRQSLLPFSRQLPPSSDTTWQSAFVSTLTLSCPLPLFPLHSANGRMALVRMLLDYYITPHTATQQRSSAS